MRCNQVSVFRLVRRNGHGGEVAEVGGPPLVWSDGALRRCAVDWSSLPFPSDCPLAFPSAFPSSLCSEMPGSKCALVRY